jgi:hypothetical protein
MRWELVFEGIPPGPNHRMHWRQKAVLTQTWRHKAFLLAKDARIPPQERVRISARFLRRSLGVADEDNDRSRLKPAVDGIVEAGVIPKDTRGHIVWGDVTEEHGKPGVVLVIETIDTPGATAIAPGRVAEVGDL